MLGVETALAVVLTTLVEPGVLTLAQALAALSWQPARVAGLDADGHGGPIAPGRPANLCVIDPAHQWVVDGDAPREPVARTRRGTAGSSPARSATPSTAAHPTVRDSEPTR